MSDKKMHDSAPVIPKVKQLPFNKEAFLRAAEKVKKIVEKEQKHKTASQNA